MSIKFHPDKLLSKIGSKKIKRMLTEDLTLKKAALSFVDDISILDKKAISKVALKTIRDYRERVAKETADAGFDPTAGAALEAEILANPAQLIQRVQNEIVFQVHDVIKEKYSGNTATWLPSDADEPRPEHQLNYGKSYIIGEGIDGVEPGDEYGCRCGVEIDTKDSSLSLD